MPWNMLKPPDEFAGPEEPPPIEPEAWTSVYGYRPGQPGYQTAVDAAKGKRGMRVVDLREEQLKKALSDAALRQKRSQLGIDPVAFRDYAQEAGGAALNPPGAVLQGLGEAAAWGSAGIWAKQTGEIPPDLGGYIKPHAPNPQVWAKQQADLGEENERQRYLAARLEGMTYQDKVDFYKEQATPEEQLMIESLIPGIGFAPMPPVVKGAQLAAKFAAPAAKAVERTAKGIDWASEAGAVRKGKKIPAGAAPVPPDVPGAPQAAAKKKSTITSRAEEEDAINRRQLAEQEKAFTNAEAIRTRHAAEIEDVARKAGSMPYEQLVGDDNTMRGLLEWYYEKTGQRGMASRMRQGDSIQRIELSRAQQLAQKELAAKPVPELPQAVKGKEPWEMTVEELSTNPPPGVKFDPQLKYEGDAHTGVIRLGPKFFELSIGSRKHVFLHEAAHGIEDAVLRDPNFYKMIQEQNMFGPIHPESGRILRGINGRTKPSENFVEAYVLLGEEPEWLKEHFPVAYRYVSEQAVKQGKPVPPEVLADLGLAKPQPPPAVKAFQEFQQGAKAAEPPTAAPEAPPVAAGGQPIPPTSNVPPGGQPPPPPGPPPLRPRVPTPPSPGEPPRPPTNDPLKRTEEALKHKEDPFDVRLRRGYSRFLIHWSDRIDPATGLAKETGVPVHDVLQLVPGATGRGDELIRLNMNPIVKRVEKDADNLQTYMTLMRDIDLLNRGPRKLIGLTIQGTAKLPGNLAGYGEVTQALADLEKKVGTKRYQAIENAANELYTVHDRLTLQARVDAGLLSPEQAQAIRTAHPHYIPFHRQGFDELEDFANKYKRPEGSVSNIGIERMDVEGSTRDLDRPLYRLMGNVIQTERIIARNEAARTLTTALQEMEKARGKAPGSLISPAKPNAQHTISYFENGKKITMQLEDEIAIFADVAKNMDAEANNLLSNVGRKLALPLSKGAVTYNPGYMPTNIIRDTTSALFREKLIPMGPDVWRALFSVIRKDADYSDAALAKVFMSGMAENLRTADVIRRAKDINGIPIRSVKDLIAFVPRLIEKGNIVTEQTTRVAVYRKLRRQGVPQTQAAVRARDATVDFAKAGTAMQTVNAVLPFSNAGLQGAINTLRTFKHKPAWAGTVAGILSAPTIMSRVNNMRFPDTNELIPDYEYLNNWVIQYGEGTRKDGSKFPMYFKVPKGQIAAQLTFPAETAFHVARKNDDRSVVEMILRGGLDATKQLAPVDPNISGVMPPLPATVTSMAVNKNLFTGSPIIPRKEEALLPEQQFGPETSVQAIVLGQKFGISPRMIQFAIDDYTAGAGQTVSWMLDLGLKALGYDPEPFGAAKLPALTPEEQRSRAPIMKRFLGTKDTQMVRQGYEQLDAVTDDTNRAFAELPEVNRLGIRLGQVGDVIQNIPLTPKHQAEYQQYVAEKVTEPMRQFLSGKLPDDPAERTKTIQKKMAELKKVAQRTFIKEQLQPPDNADEATMKLYQFTKRAARFDDFERIFLSKQPDEFQKLYGAYEQLQSGDAAERKKASDMRLKNPSIRKFENQLDAGKAVMRLQDPTLEAGLVEYRKASPMDKKAAYDVAKRTQNPLLIQEYKKRFVKP